MGIDYIKKILLVGSSGKRDNEWGMGGSSLGFQGSNNMEQIMRIWSVVDD